MRAQSIVQTGKCCFITGEENVLLDVHHLLNGALRNWADEQGLWVYLRHDIHMYIHHVNRKQLRELKQVAQYCYERTHTREEWMKRVRTNYLCEPLTTEQLKKYRICDLPADDGGLDVSEPINFELLKGGDIFGKN